MRVFLTPFIITQVASDMPTCNQGHGLYEKDAVSEMTFVKQGSVYVLSAKVEESPKYQRVYIVFSGAGELSSYQCNCGSSRVWKGACKHVCAALFAVLFENRDREKQQIINRRANNMLTAFEKISLKAQNTFRMPEEEKITLVPKVIFYKSADYEPEQYCDMYLSFQVGGSRKYIVKNVGEFLDAVENNKVMSYGKNLAFMHSAVNFDEKSRKLLEFLQKEIENARDYLKTYVSNLDRVPHEREIPLSLKGMDVFFDLYSGQRVAASIDGCGDGMLFTEEEVPLKYDLTDLDGEIVLSGNNLYDLVRGYSSDYLISGDAMYKIDTEKSAVIMAIEKELKADNSYSVRFSQQSSGKFINFVLPALKSHNLADTSAIDRKYDIRELTKKVYLDTEDAAVTAKVLFCYDEYEINALAHDQEHKLFRDDLAESALKNCMEQYGFTGDKSSMLYVLKDVSKTYNFYKYGVDHLNGMATVYATDDFTRKSQKVSYTKTTFGLRLKGDLLEISPVNSDFSMRDLLDIVDAFNSKKKFYRLRDGRFLDLTESDLSETAEFLDALDLSGRDIKEDSVKISASRAMYVDNLISGEESAFFDRDEAFKKIISDFKSGKEKEFKVPDTLNNVLRGYQKEGFRWLALMTSYRFGGILADDMGLGKTVQVISEIVYQKETQGKQMPSLIVAPTSLIYNWEREFEKFAPEINTLVISETSKRRKNDITDDIDAIITTYDILKRDLDFFTERDYNFVIADEAQNIKNPVTQNARAIKKLNASTRFALTGTPVENSLSELWSIFDFVMPGYLRSYNRFSKDYETPITKSKEPEKAERLKKLIAPFILRRVKKDVLSEIPDKLETNLYAEMTEEQRKIYLAYYMKAKGELDDISDKNMMKESRIKILSFITRLRQICCHPGVFMDNYSGGSGKLSIVMETVRNCVDSGHRMLLFSQFTSILDIVIGELKKEGIPYFYIDGATPAKRRNNMTDSFNNGENPIFLISLKAGGTGLNLTGADTVIHFDPWWNPAVMDQASDRAHRIGQKNVVQVFNVVAKDTIEEKILSLQDKKRDLIDLVITDGANFINKLTSEEIYALFA